jgi:hypothetical protein
MKADQEERAFARQEIDAALAPAGVRIAHVAPLLGGWSAIWYWGRETSFAGGRTVAQVIASIERQVFGGL